MNNDLNQPDRWQPSSIALTPDEIPGILTQELARVIHFWAPWNRIDRQMDAAVQILADQFKHRVRFYSYNADQPGSDRLFRHIRPDNLPTLAMFAAHRTPRLLLGNIPAVEASVEIENFLSRDFEYVSRWQFWKKPNSSSREVRLRKNWHEELQSRGK